MGSELLNRRKFGNTSLEVPPIAMGCAPLGDMQDTFLYSVPEDEAIADLAEMLAEAGVAAEIDAMRRAGDRP